jgi:hypothetical protein
MRQNKKWFRLVGTFTLVTVISTWSLNAFAQSSSTNYRIEESYFGTGGEVDASSTSYRSRQSTGSLGVGNTSSTNYDAVAGATTPSEPFLEMEVTGASVNFGTLSPSTTSYAAAQGGTCNCTFTVRTYLSSEYSVYTVSQSLTNESGDVLDPKTTQGAPSGDSSVEEFGINLVANTVPGTFGAGPVNEPDNTFADGQVATGYQTANQYKYGVGDIIARSQATAGNQAVGKTNYTISYIAKISNISEAGTYTMRHDLVVVPTF